MSRAPTLFGGGGLGRAQMALAMGNGSGLYWTMAHGGLHRPSCSVCGLASSLAAVAAIITPHNQAMSLQDGIHSAAAIVLVLGGLF